MKIGIDITSIETSPDGTGQYISNLLDALFKIDKENEYILYSSQPYTTKKQNIVIRRHKILPFKGITWMKKVSNHAKKNDVDVLLSPSNHLFCMLFKKVISFVYDLTPIYYPEFYSWKDATVYKLGIKHMIPRSYRIVALTNTVKDELIKYTNIPKERVGVVYPSINHKIIDEAVDFVDLGFPKNYILSISTLSPKKNIVALLEGFKKYLIFSGDNETKLVIIGRKGWKFGEIYNKIQSLDLLGKIILPGYVEDRYIASIYRKAAAFILLSKHEGFGMPILEALHFNLPVIANDIPVFRECFGDNITYVDAQNAQLVGASIAQIINNPIKTKFDNGKFTWEKSAQDLLNLINS